MLTDGVENASTAMYENVKALAQTHVWTKRNAVSQFPAAGRGFKNNSYPAVRILLMSS